MEDLNKLMEVSEKYPMQLEQIAEDFFLKLRVILWGHATVASSNEKLKNSSTASPKQTKKRAKRLSLLNEDNEPEDKLEILVTDSENDKKCSPLKCKPSNSELLAMSDATKDANIEMALETLVSSPKPKCEGLAVSNEESGKNAEQRKISGTSETKNLMPPPQAPIRTDELENKRPQRAAKLKSEKHLKEPKLSTKLRRPTNEVKVKLEHEHRSSQLHQSTTNTKCPVPPSSTDIIESKSLSRQKSDESVVIIPEKQSVVSINSDGEDSLAVPFNKDTGNEQKKSTDSIDNGIREIRVKIKREKGSFSNTEETPKTVSGEAVFKVPEALPPPMILPKVETTTVDDETTLASSSLSSTTAAPAKKVRKKKNIVHKPIKVERFSDLDPKPSPISSRTRHGSLNKTNNETSPTEESKRQASIYEDAVETPSSNNSKGIHSKIASGIVNETVNLEPSADATINLGGTIGNATFCTNLAQTTFQVAPAHTTFVMESNPNVTVTLNKHSGNNAPADSTFDVHQMTKTMKSTEDDAATQRSFETAKDTSRPNDDDSIMTEDEPEKPIVTKPKAESAAFTKAKVTMKTAAPAKATYKMAPRAQELFNPLAQSPVKMRVEAFENAAAAASAYSKRTLRNKKENATPTSVTTPTIGKLPAPVLGRFLTPTQSSNISTINGALVKKGTTSASKALAMPKSTNASSLLRSNSAASSKTLQRENSADDFRKGLHSLAEERKKQREQKHLLAAQQREAKERERAERMAKLAKEREEKRLLKKQQEQEQKKRDLEEIQRKLRQQQEEEAAKLKAAKEREMLLHMKQQQQQSKQKMMPPPPKITSKYTFEMLHEDDSTDDENKVSYKRPPPPSWSRSHFRGPNVLKQEYTPSAYIDSFFSVQPMTPDLKIIFPNIDARHLKRNSSVLWSTPPRYSELPKY